MKKIFLTAILATTSIAANLSPELELVQKFTDAIDYGDYKKFEEILKSHPDWIKSNKEDLIKNI